MAAGAIPALAHAQLEDTFPADGETLSDSPGEVLVVFNEPITAPAAAIRVFDSSGTRVDSGTVVTTDSGVRLVGELEDDLGNGTFVATWRAVSADGHPINGAFVFHVGGPGAAVDDSLIASLLGDTEGRIASVLAGVARWVTYLSSLTVIGAVVFPRVIEPSQPHATVRLIRIACSMGIGFSVLQIPLFAISSSGLGLEALTSASIWMDALVSSVGVAALVRLVGFALLWAVSTRWSPWLGWPGIALLVGAELITGHTRTTEPAWLVIPAAAIHVLAAGLWLGGLISLLIMLRARRREEDPFGAGSLVAGFSRLAMWTVLALTVAGAALAWSQVRAPYALTSTAYGWTLITKIGLVALVLGVALYNNRVLVPKISREGSAESAWRLLGQTVRWEITGLVLVVGVTALLVNLQPAAEAAGVSGPFSTYVEFGEGQLNLVVEPNRTGLNTIHATVLTVAGLPGRFTGPVGFELSMPEEEIGPIVRVPLVAGPSHVIHTGPELAIPGNWEITVRERVSEFEEEVAVIEVRVGG